MGDRGALRAARINRLDHRVLMALPFALILHAAFAVPLRADVRVVVAFDSQGPRLITAVAATASLPKLVGQQAVGKQPSANVEPVQINWFDAAGRLLDIERVADPRIAHFHGMPLDGTESRPGGRVALNSGALLLRGPDAARRVNIELPSSRVPLLAAASWSFDLAVADGFSDRLP